MPALMHGDNIASRIVTKPGIAIKPISKDDLPAIKYQKKAQEHIHKYNKIKKT